MYSPQPPSARSQSHRLEGLHSQKGAPPPNPAMSNRLIFVPIDVQPPAPQLPLRRLRVPKRNQSLNILSCRS
jgi:hypothetical protein